MPCKPLLPAIPPFPILPIDVNSQLAQLDGECDFSFSACAPSRCLNIDSPPLSGGSSVPSKPLLSVMPTVPIQSIDADSQLPETCPYGAEHFIHDIDTKKNKHSLEQKILGIIPDPQEIYRILDAVTQLHERGLKVGWWDCERFQR